MKCRRLRSDFMNNRSQPFGDVSLTRPLATLSRWERDCGDALSDGAVYARHRKLSSIVLQLQPRYRKCVHFHRGAYIKVENVRTGSLRTKGAYISGSDVRTCSLETVVNLLQLRRAERRGRRSLQKAISVPGFALRLSPGQVARGGDARFTGQSSPPSRHAIASGVESPLLLTPRKAVP